LGAATVEPRSLAPNADALDAEAMETLEPPLTENEAAMFAKAPTTLTKTNVETINVEATVTETLATTESPTTKSIPVVSEDAEVAVPRASTVMSQPLAGKLLVVTGRLSSLSPQETEKLIVEAGGTVAKMPNTKTSYIVVGNNPGSSKLKKAEKYNIPQLDESEFLALLSIEPGALS
jgi:BRCT domain type II-containing protein